MNPGNIEVVQYPNISIQNANFSIKNRNVTIANITETEMHSCPDENSKIVFVKTFKTGSS